MESVRKSFDVLLYLDVPYREKDEAKALGARFDGAVKKWYYRGDAGNLVRFAKWILKGKEETVITNEIYLIKNKRGCWKCKKDTTVIALGIGEFLSMYYDDWNQKVGMEFNFNKERNPCIHIAWTDNEQDIPPLLLRYLKNNYPVRTGYSSIAGNCFANHCEHCGAIQGNFHLFNEMESPFFLYAASGEEMEEKVKNLEVFHLPIDFTLQLNWDVYVTDEDESYESFWDDEIIVTGTKRDPQYKDMYDL